LLLTAQCAESIETKCGCAVCNNQKRQSTKVQNHGSIPSPNFT